MFFSRALTAAALLGLARNVQAQCINNVAAYNPNLRSQTSNITIFVVPVPKSAALAVLTETYPLQNLTLLDVPTSDTSLFPDGFPEGHHPVYAAVSYNDDIRLTALQIDGPLIVGSVLLTYVSQNGGAAPLGVPISQYIAGPNGPLPNGLVPAVASSVIFAGAPIRLGQFLPQGAPYQTDGEGNLSSDVKWAVVPNSVSGPGIYSEVADFLFTTIDKSQSKYTAKTFKELLNQPQVLPSGLCQRNTYYFTNATAVPTYRHGQVTLGAGADGISLSSSTLQSSSPDGSGVYTGLDAFSGCAQLVGYNPEDCQTAGANVDLGSLN